MKEYFIIGEKIMSGLYSLKRIFKDLFLNFSNNNVKEKLGISKQ